MNYKVQAMMQNARKKLIIFAILWLVIIILGVAPFSAAIAEAAQGGAFNFEIFFESLGKYITNPFSSFGVVFSSGYIGAFLKCTFYFSIVFLVAAAIGILKSAPKNEYTDIEHGSSGWAEHGEQYRVLSKKSGIILAEDNYLPLNKMGNINVLVVGGSGSGKSASYSIPNAYQCLGSYVFTDPKGELYDRTAGYLKAKGYKVRVLNLVNPECSDGYNPLAHIRNEIDVDIIANTIVKGQTGEKASDPFWDDMAEILLKALIWYLISTRPPEEQNLASCAELVRAANDSGGTSLLGDLINQLDYTHPARKNYKSIEIAPEKTRGSILSTLQSRLGKFDSKDIAELTSTDTINFEEIGQEKTAVYVISSDTHTTYNFLLTIFFSQMIQQLYDFADKSGGKLPEKTFFILDEFANIGQIPDFDKKISTSRSRGISFSVILQNLDQLEAVYEKSYETIIGNCDTHVFLGSNSTKTLEYFSKALGEKTIFRDSHSTNRDREGWKSGSSDSDQSMGRALLTPDELRRFDNDKCIIFVKGVRPIQANKFYYFRKPMGREMARFEISHNDAEVGQRGEWRIFNPANPYAGNEEQKAQDLNVESLDDLFEDDKPENKTGTTPKKVDSSISQNSDLATKTSTNTQKPEPKPMEIPLEDNNEEVNNADLEKALEAKFDELFGVNDDD